VIQGVPRNVGLRLPATQPPNDRNQRCAVGKTGRIPSTVLPSDRARYAVHRIGRPNGDSSADPGLEACGFVIAVEGDHVGVSSWIVGDSLRSWRDLTTHPSPDSTLSTVGSVKPTVPTRTPARAGRRDAISLSALSTVRPRGRELSGFIPQVPHPKPVLRADWASIRRDLLEQIATIVGSSRCTAPGL